VMRTQTAAAKAPLIQGAGRATPSYTVTAGSVRYRGQVDCWSSDPEQRARIGLFLGFQYPMRFLRKHLRISAGGPPMPAACAWLAKEDLGPVPPLKIWSVSGLEVGLQMNPSFLVSAASTKASSGGEKKTQ